MTEQSRALFLEVVVKDWVEEQKAEVFIEQRPVCRVSISLYIRSCVWHCTYNTAFRPVAAWNESVVLQS